MAGTARTTQVRTRQRARTRLADTLAAQREREKANEDDLAAFFALDDQIQAAAQVRDGQIKVSQGAHQLRLRGKVKAEIEWTFHLACHNFRKLAGSGWTTAQMATG